MRLGLVRPNCFSEGVPGFEVLAVARSKDKDELAKQLSSRIEALERMVNMQGFCMAEHAPSADQGV